MSRRFYTGDTEPWTEKYGDGSDSDLTISTNTTFAEANSGCSWTSGSRTLTLDGASTFANGDLVIIHQSRGTGVGSFELNKILSGGGTSTLTLAYDLQNTYTDSGSSQAQIVKLRQYNSVTVDAGITWTAPAWDKSKGGILAFLCRGAVTINGAVSASQKGYLASTGNPGAGNTGIQGEGTVGDGGSATSANGNGGGGGEGAADGGAGGGGGGHGAAGSTGSSGSPHPGTGGAGGASAGNADLNLGLVFGGAGGMGGYSHDGTNWNIGGRGGNGGGFIAIFAPTITINPTTGSIASNAANGNPGSGGSGGGGGGAGGAVFLKGRVISIGTNRITVASGSGGSGSSGGGDTGGAGGAGAVGRIHIDYLVSLSGSSTPTVDSSQDFILTLTRAIITSFML